MQMQLIETSDKKPASSLYVVKTFKKVIESRDINNMTKELYNFLNLYCGFIAHYDINGLKSVYSKSAFVVSKPEKRRIYRERKSQTSTGKYRRYI